MRRLVLLAAAFAALSVTVALGAFTWLDQWAVDHLMPTLGPAEDHGLAGLLLPLTDWDGVRALLGDLWLYPASVPVSGLILFACGRRLWRGWVWPAAWLVGTTVEVLVKTVLERPALYQGALHLEDFDHALPSGHTLRSLLVAAAITRTWPRAARWAWAWAASVWILLVAQGWHVPTDVAAGLLLGSLLALLADHVQRRGVDLRERAPARDDREPVAVES